MATMTFEPMAVPLREDEYGAIRVGNTRVLLDLVIHAFRDGASAEGIVESYDALNLAVCMPSSATTCVTPSRSTLTCGGVSRRPRRFAPRSRLPSHHDPTSAPC